MVLQMAALAHNCHGSTLDQQHTHARPSPSTCTPSIAIDRMTRSPGLRLAAVLLLLLLSVAVAAVPEARSLKATVGEVATKRVVHDDPNGGVAPLEERLAAAAAKWAPRQARLEVEARCRREGDAECKELVALKQQQARAAEKADYEADYEERKEVEAPCRQSGIINYFLGTTCLPTTPFDVRPAKEEEEGGDKAADAANEADADNDAANDDAPAATIDAGLTDTDVNDDYGGGDAGRVLRGGGIRVGRGGRGGAVGVGGGVGRGGGRGGGAGGGGRGGGRGAADRR